MARAYYATLDVAQAHTDLQHINLMLARLLELSLCIARLDYHTFQLEYERVVLRRSLTQSYRNLQAAQARLAAASLPPVQYVDAAVQTD